MKEFVDLKEYSTFRLGGVARYFFVARKVEDIKEAFDFAELNNLTVFVLGGGSNILISHPEIFEVVVLKIEMTGFEVLEDASDSVVVKIGAGENWDEVVRRAVENNWSGIEALSAIPGTVGGTPIQNVGAYGTEIADVLTSVEAFRIASGEMVTLSKEDCEFKYRDSLFKNDGKNKYVITSVTLKLSKSPPKVPDYPGVKKYFTELGITEPSLQQIREAIISIRKQKLPDPKEVPSVGSFFKNPMVSAEQYQKLKTSHPEIVAFPHDDKYKISAGWLLESLNLKGQQVGNLQFYPNNALVLTNTGGATFAELVQLVQKTKATIKEAYGIDLEMEPIIV